MRWPDEEGAPRLAGAYGRTDADTAGTEPALPAEQPEADKGVLKDFYLAIRNLVSSERIDSIESHEYVDLTDRSGVLAFRTDKELRITLINEEAQRALGLNEDVLGRSLIGSVLPLTGATAAKLELWRHRLSEGMERYHSLIVETEDATRQPIWINFSVEPTFDEEGVMDGTKWSGRNVSEAVLNSTKACSENSIGPLVEALPLPALLLAQDGHILAWNQRWLDAFSIRPAQAIVTPESLLSSMLAAVTDHHSFMERVMRSQQEPETVPIELWTGEKYRCSFFNLNLTGTEPEVLALLQMEDHIANDGAEPTLGLNAPEQSFELRTIMDLVHVLQSLLDLLDQGMFILNEQGEIIQWNACMERMTGLPSQETLGVGLMELDDHIPGMAYLEAEMRRNLLGLDLLAPEEALKIKLWFNHPKELDLTVWTFPVMTSKGRMVICRCSEDERSEQRAEHEAQLACHGLVENERDLLLVTDHQGQVIYRSDTAQELLRTDKRNILGKNIVELLPDWFRSEAAEGNTLFLKDGRGFEHRYGLSMIRLPGPPVCYLFHGAEEEHEVPAEEPTVVNGLAEQLLEEFDHPSIVIDEKGVVLMSNLKAKELFPLQTAEELWCRVVPDYDQDLCREMLAEACRRYKMEGLGIHFNTLDGSLYQVCLEVRTLLNGGGAPMAFVLHVRSLENNKDEPMTQMSCNDAGTDEVVGGAGTVSRACEATPISEGAVDMVDAPIAAPLDKHAQLVLDYAQIGQAELGWFSLPELCRIAAAEMQADGYEGLGDMDQVSFYADPLIVKVLPKLLENAMKHAEGAQNIDIKFHMGQYGGYLVVQDDGPGIPEGRKQEIFEPVPGSRTIHDLYFIRQLLALTGIEIIENGVFGQGARFEMFIPCDGLLR